MKKLAIIAILAASVSAAMAADVGLRVGRNTGSDTSMVGVTVGMPVGRFGAEAAFDRSTVGAINVNRYSLVGSYPVATVMGATVAAKAGAAVIDPSVGSNGLVGVVGVGVSYPLTKNVNLVADYAYQRGASSVRAYSGNMFTAGAKYSF